MTDTTDLSDLTPAEREDFEERAAIREFSGKQGREAAERGALEDVLRARGTSPSSGPGTATTSG